MWFRRTEKRHPEAERAVADAKKNLAQIHAREPEVHAVAEASRRFRRENHFAQSLQHVFGGPPS